MIEIKEMANSEIYHESLMQVGQVVYSQYYSKVYKLCYWKLRSVDEAEDIASEVFHRVIAKKKMLNFKGESSFWSWLRVITANCCSAYLMKKQRERSFISYYPELSPIHEKSYVTTSATPEEEAIVDQMHRYYIKAVETLEDKYKKPILLVYREGLSYKQASKVLNIKTGTLGVRLLRARSALESKIQEMIQYN